MSFISSSISAVVQAPTIFKLSPFWTLPPPPPLLGGVIHVGKNKDKTENWLWKSSAKWDWLKGGSSMEP